MSLTAPARVDLVKGVADGLNYLHSENVVHGDLHPGNVLIDGSGNPCLTDFGLATIEGDAELQLTTMTANQNPRWHAPEVIGIDHDPGRPTFKSDIYSFGSVMFFIASGDMPWQEKRYNQIIIELSRRAISMRSGNILDNHWNLVQKCWSWDPKDRPGCAEVLKCMGSMLEAKLKLLREWLEDNNVSDFTSQLAELGPPITCGSFGEVYQHTVVTSEGETVIAVKKFVIDHETAMAKMEKGIVQRELKVWLKLRHSTIVPLLGIAFLDHPFPALVSQWMPSGTLYNYLEKRAMSLTAPARVDLVKGVADGLNYLHSENVVHGDLHPGNVLIDGSGNPCLTDFGLATIEGDAELQLTTMTANQNPRWHAPEVIGIDHDPGRPTFKSDIYSFGSVMFFIASGDMPWQEKRYNQIIIELSRRAISMRSGNILDNHWNLVQKCWSWDPKDRPGCAEVLKCMGSMLEAKLKLLREWLEDNNVSDFTSQLAELGPPITCGSFGEVYQHTVVTSEGETVVCLIIPNSSDVRLSSIHQIAVKKFVIDHETTMAKMEKGIVQRELKVWLKLRHSTIVPLLGIAFLDHPFPALVSQWMPSGTLYNYLEMQATTLTAPARADLAKGVADGLNYLHSENVVHGDLCPGNVLIDGSGNPCLTDFGLATVVWDGELQLTTMIANRNPRWHAPEVIGIDRDPGRPTFKSDIYSFGCVMFFIASGDMPWQEKKYNQIIIELSRRAIPMRPGNILDNHLNLVRKCWSWDPKDRPGCAEVLKWMGLMLGTKLRLLREWLEDNNVSDFTSQLAELGPPITRGAFGRVYQRTVVTNEGETVVAVKKFMIDHERAMAKMEMGIGHRELKVWLKLRHSTIVPLLGIAFLDLSFPVLVSQWMPSGTLYNYLEKQATTFTTPARVDLVKGVADGLNYLHSENVVHGDLHPGNVLIDGSGNPCLTDFGLATVVGDEELQLTTTIANQNPRWHAPEVIGIDRDPGRPTFKSDIYSFGSVMFFIVSGDIPWQEKRSYQIVIELSRRVIPIRPGNILDNHWNLIHKCWSLDPNDRPGCAEVLKCMSSSSNLNDSRGMSIPVNMTSQEEYRGRPRNVVLYGEAGSGKSSLINLIMGRNVAITSPDALLCTSLHTPYDVMIGGQYFRLWDTAGRHIFTPTFEARVV
ncbi:kinase-like protein [Rhizopogon salebrosus TDB-379]|nr:kinase-like protein [Rhizopogon salebrosus TDB-379]